MYSKVRIKSSRFRVETVVLKEEEEKEEEKEETHIREVRVGLARRIRQRVDLLGIQAWRKGGE